VGGILLVRQPTKARKIFVGRATNKGVQVASGREPDHSVCFRSYRLCVKLRRCWSAISPLAVVGRLTNNYICTMLFFDNPAQFFTATNLNWLPVLKHDTCKQLVVDALKFRVARKQVTVYAFVIMPNHLHIIWQYMMT
jgi:hypothetical protein